MVNTYDHGTNQALEAASTEFFSLYGYCNTRLVESRGRKEARVIRESIVKRLKMSVA